MSLAAYTDRDGPTVNGARLGQWGRDMADVWFACGDPEYVAQLEDATRQSEHFRSMLDAARAAQARGFGLRESLAAKIAALRRAGESARANRLEIMTKAFVMRHRR
jgi:hypothetical protein